jgi:hypothetical protein
MKRNQLSIYKDLEEYYGEWENSYELP